MAYQWTGYCSVCVLVVEAQLFRDIMKLGFKLSDELIHHLTPPPRRWRKTKQISEQNFVRGSPARYLISRLR